MLVAQQIKKGRTLKWEEEVEDQGNQRVIVVVKPRRQAVKVERERPVDLVTEGGKTNLEKGRKATREVIDQAAVKVLLVADPGEVVRAEAIEEDEGMEEVVE